MLPRNLNGGYNIIAEEGTGPIGLVTESVSDYFQFLFAEMKLQPKRCTLPEHRGRLPQSACAGNCIDSGATWAVPAPSPQNIRLSPTGSDELNDGFPRLWPPFSAPSIMRR